MPTQTGTATSASDLLDKFRLFATANGWTQNQWTAEGTGSRLHLAHAGAGLWLNLRSAVNENLTNLNAGSSINTSGVALNMSDGYDAAQAWNRQPGAPGGTDYPSTRGAARVHNVAGAIPSYRFYAEASPGPWLAAAIEFAAGKWQHWGAGKIVPYGVLGGSGAFFWGSWAGGSNNENLTTANANILNYNDPPLLPFRANYYNYGCNAFVRAGLDTYPWLGNGQPGQSGYYGYPRRRVAADVVLGMGKLLFDRTPNVFNGSPVLLPINLYGERDGGLYSPLGRLPGMRLINLTNTAAPQILSVGGVDWDLLPLYQQGGFTLQYGLAVRRTP